MSAKRGPDSGAVRMSPSAGSCWAWKTPESIGGCTALRYLETINGRVVLVVGDAVTPDLDETSVARVVRDRHPGVPVIQTTGYPGDEGRRAHLGETDAAPLAKPSESHELPGDVRRVLDMSDNHPTVTRRA